MKHFKRSFGQLADASGNAIDAIGPDDERAIGQAAALNIIQQSGGLVLDHGLVAYVNAVANYVGLHGERAVTGKDGIARLKARRFFVGILDDDSMNAYALPGGYILVTRGLLENLSCEADLAWVLGHEIAHVDNEDGLKALKAAVGTTAFAKELVHFGAAAEPKEEDADASKASFENPDFFAKVVDKLTSISFSLGLGRDDERQADALGLQYAIRAGYDAKAAKRVLDLLATFPSKRKVFKTHDEPPERLQLLTRKILDAPAGHLGITRFDRGAIQRLEAVRHAGAR